MPADDDIEAFRGEVRAFLDTRLPARLRRRVAEGCYPSYEELKDWIRILADHGWSAPSWPKAHGGAGFTPRQRAVFDEECALADAPAIETLGLSVIGPMIITLGSEAQKARYLPKILTAEEYWCQGFSEPEAGSDLASLTTRATRDGDGWRLDGTKIWTSDAHVSDRMLCLARTDPEAPKHKGISAFLVDMRDPGVTVRPVPWMNGVHGFNQVFFDGVRLEADQILGEEGQGWTVAMRALVPERVYVSRIAENKRLLKRLKAAMQEPDETGRPLAEDSGFAARAARLEIRLLALEARFDQFLEELEAGREVGPETSLLKLTGSRLIQGFEEMLIEAYGPATLPFDAERVAATGGNLQIGPPLAGMTALRAFHHRGYTIGSGASEIQREILARRVIGL